MKKIERQGLSADCTLNPAVVLSILIGWEEHPCDRCNMDRSICHGYPRLQENSKVKEQCLNDWPLGEEPYPPL